MNLSCQVYLFVKHKIFQIFFNFDPWNQLHLNVHAIWSLCRSTDTFLYRKATIICLKSRKLLKAIKDDKEILFLFKMCRWWFVIKCRGKYFLMSTICDPRSDLSDKLCYIEINPNLRTNERTERNNASCDLIPGWLSVLTGHYLIRRLSVFFYSCTHNCDIVLELYF